MELWAPLGWTFICWEVFGGIGKRLKFERFLKWQKTVDLIGKFRLLDFWAKWTVCRRSVRGGLKLEIDELEFLFGTPGPASWGGGLKRAARIPPGLIKVRGPVREPKREQGGLCVFW